jgi:hypothetical protein
LRSRQKCFRHSVYRATVWFQGIKSPSSSKIFKASAVDLTWIEDS